MFVDAITTASSFTFPLIISNRFQDGSISSHLGSFVLLNEEGWILTAAHIIGETKKHLEHVEEYRNYLHGEGVVINPKWILHHSLWFGADEHHIPEFHLLPENDLAIGQIKDFVPKAGQRYPKIIDPSAIRAGRSLCRLGFPFYEINATFSGNTFHYSSELFPIPHFPLDGILTRAISGGNAPWGEVKWLETSTPGLRGQSGGPLFDSQANLWGIQSMTRHLPLGFTPSVNKGGEGVDQFINLGWSVHPEVICHFLDRYQVRYQRAEVTA